MFDYSAYYANHMKDLVGRVRGAVQSELRRTYIDLFRLQSKKIEGFFNKAVQDFYNDYSPRYYVRHESLYDLLQIRKGDGFLELWFDPNSMTPFRSGYSGEDGLYDQVFRHGWHGGAADGPGHPSPGTPYWRTRYFTAWGRPASVAGKAPLDAFNERLREYLGAELKGDFEKIWRDHEARLKDYM